MVVRAFAATLSDFASWGVLTSRVIWRASRAEREPLTETPDPWLSEYAHAGVEPSLEEVLGDPIIQAVMRSDRLDQDDVRAASSGVHR